MYNVIKYSVKSCTMETYHSYCDLKCIVKFNLFYEEQN